MTDARKLENDLKSSLHRHTSTPADSWQCLNGVFAPNSWTLLNRATSEVWKIVTPRALKFLGSFDRFLEKEAIDRIPGDIGVVKYTKEGEIKVDGVDQKLPYLVFPFMQGVSLDKEIALRKKSQKGFSDEEITKTARALTKSISGMFRSGVIHQDIKPGNVIIGKNGEVILLDLGLARFVNEDLKLIKRMEGPYAYLSPERLDMIADMSISNKRMLGFSSDLFSVGMILFEMATLERLISKVQPGEIRNAHGRLKELGVRDSLIVFISGFLKESPLERQAVVGELTGEGWFSKNSDQDVKVWIQHHHNGFRYISDMLSSGKEDDIYGVILAGDQLQKEESYKQKSKLFHDFGSKVGVDPAIFRLVYDDEHHGYLIHRDYGYRVGSNIFLRESLLKKGYDFVMQVMDFQIRLDTDILIAPYFGVERVTDNWLDVNFAAWSMAYEYIKSKSLNKQLYLGLMLSERLVCSRGELDQVLTQIIFDQTIKNVYLRLESDRLGSTPNENDQFLLNVRFMIKTLTDAGKAVLYGFSDVDVLGYLQDGLTSFAINPDFEKRKQLIFDKYSKPKQPIKKKSATKKRYFAQELWNDVLTDAELFSPEAISRGSKHVFACGCPYCFLDGNDQRLDQDSNRKHFLFSVGKLAGKMSSVSLDERGGYFISHLKKARENYDYLQRTCGLQFDKSTDSSFIDVWLAVFK